MKAEISDFCYCEKLKRNYPQCKMLIWTEDAWQIFGAQAVAFNPNYIHVLVKFKGEYLIIAEKRVQDFKEMFKN